MQLIMESFWRALLDSFRPRIIGLSFLPLLLIAVAALVLGYFYWGAAVLTVTEWMNASVIWTWIDGRLSTLGAQNITAIFAPLLVILLASPVLIMLSLLLVTMLMTPAMAKQVAQRRFPGLKPQVGASFWRSLIWSVSSTCVALLAFIVSLPLWLIPPMALIVPPLIWGWLAYRVMSFDALVDYTSAQERKTILEQHRWPLLIIGLICGFLGAVPSLVWASSVIFALAFFILIPVAVCLFTWVFALTSLWYAHYCLAVLAQRRGPQALLPDPVAPVAPVAPKPQPRSPAGPVADPVSSPSSSSTSHNTNDDVSTAAKAGVAAVVVSEVVQASAATSAETSATESPSDRLIATDVVVAEVTVPDATPSESSGASHDASQDSSDFASHSSSNDFSSGSSTSDDSPSRD